MAEIVERGWSEVLKITRAPNLIQSNLCYLELDGRQVGTVYAFEGCYDRIREALEEREATPEEGYLLEEQGREIATLVKRLANAELLIEKLKEEVKELNFSVALHDRNVALRTAEESSVVDRTPAKQPDDSSNTDGDGDSVIDDNHLQVELDCEALRELIEKKLSQRVENIKKAISSPTLSPELAARGRELVRLAEKSLGEVEG